jgi:7-cyano-7-deazaguanine synthase
VRALVLLSGGQDSTTCLFWAKHILADTVGEPVELHALSVYYGQRHVLELEAAHEIGRLAGVESHVEVDLGTLFTGSTSALIEASGGQLRGEGGLPDAAMPQGLPTSFVPGRNLLFLAAAVARAGAIGADVVVTGVCQTDYSGYPDCRATFVNALQAAVNEAWPSGVEPPKVVTPLMRLTKAETVSMMTSLATREAKESGADVLLWQDMPAWRALARSLTCYYGRRPGCGSCPACILRARGFADCGLDDPSNK